MRAGGSSVRIWHPVGVLKVAGARLLDNRDAHWVRAALDSDPVTSCMVAARVETAGTDPWRLGGELWGFGPRLDGLCFSGANLVPLRGDRSAVHAFADRALRPTLNKYWVEMFPDPHSRPARHTVAHGDFTPPMQIQCDLLAVIGDS